MPKKAAKGKPEAPTKVSEDVSNLLNTSDEHALQVMESLGKETSLEMFRSMLLIRRFEERCAEMYQQRKIGGFCHLYNGQEAIAVGASFAKRRDDYLVTS